MPFVILPLTVLTMQADLILNHKTEVEELYFESQRVRAKYGIAKQTLDKECCEQAQKWAEYMASINQMKHGGGEQIIARGYSSPKFVLRGWLNSPPHQRWIYCGRNRVGFGFAKSKSGMTYWAGVYKKKKEN